LIETYDLLLIDLDGVVWRGLKPIERNVEAIRKLCERDVKIIFVTNNATKSRRTYAELLSRMLDLKISEKDVMCSGYAISNWLLNRYGKVNVYPIGEEGLIEELSKAGHRVIDGKMIDKVEAVVVSLDRTLTYRKLEYAHEAITKYNAIFTATNQDHVIPISGGTAPGAGAIIASLVKSTGVKPIFTAGKPNPYMANLILERLKHSRRRVLVVGDRCDTDVAFALNAKLDSLLVMTGVTGTIVSSKYKPTYIAKDLLEFVEKS